MQIFLETERLLYLNRVKCLSPRRRIICCRI